MQCATISTREHNDGRNANEPLLKKLRESGDLPRAPGKLETNVDVVEATAAPAPMHHPYNNQPDSRALSEGHRVPPPVRPSGGNDSYCVDEDVLYDYVDDEDLFDADGNVDLS